jgi:beta-glucanase (GH16 family)
VKKIKRGIIASSSSSLLDVSGFTLTAGEDFTTLSLWDGSTGVWATNWPSPVGLVNGSSLGGARELEWYIDHTYAPTAAVVPWSVSGGILTLTADNAASGIQPLINSYLYTSGMLTTRYSFSQLYGYFEMKAQMPSGQNLWPAFWLMPVDDTWPPEIDIVEMFGHLPTLLDTSSHCGTTGIDVVTNSVTTVANMTTGYHTYGVDWRADFIRWYFDGKQVFQVATPADCHKAMYIIVNLAIYGPGFVAGTFPQHMLVDYIRAYR